MIDAEEVRRRVEYIRVYARTDDEAAHSCEDRLHQDVLRALAEQGNELAIEALKTLDVAFARHCA